MPQSKLQSECLRYDSMLKHAPLGVVITDNVGKLVWLNPIAQSYLGDQLRLGKPVLNSKDWPGFRALILQNKPFYFLIEDQGFTFTPQALEDSESPRTLLWIVPSVSLDVDLVTMQQDLIRQRKMANLGRMMVEMAHELNNPLTGISMGTQLIGMSTKRARRLLQSASLNLEAIKDILDKIDQESSKISSSTARASALRQELLAYSKPNPLNLRPYQASRLIETVLDNFRNQPIFRHMTLKLELSDRSPTILCDASKLEQILYNLLKNAHDATHAKGQVWIREFVDENFLTIEVEDNGPGIPPDLLDKIFSPFLTTKPRTGTGLGLSISQEIIQQHGGRFSVYNKPESGACFKIQLPITNQPDASV